MALLKTGDPRSPQFGRHILWGNDVEHRTTGNYLFPSQMLPDVIS